MVRQECPGVTGRSGLAENWSESVEKNLPVRVIMINAAATPTDSHLMFHTEVADRLIIDEGV
jgi:hypothetical protein